jgi:hypothetical protein
MIIVAVDLNSKFVRQALVGVISRDIDRFGPLLLGTPSQTSPESLIEESGINPGLELMDGGIEVPTPDRSEIASEESTSTSAVLELDASVTQDLATDATDTLMPFSAVEVEAVQLETLEPAAGLLLDEEGELPPVSEIDTLGTDAGPEARLELEAESIQASSLEAKVPALDVSELDYVLGSPNTSLDEADEELTSEAHSLEQSEPLDELDSSQPPSWFEETEDPDEEEPARRLLDLLESMEVPNGLAESSTTDEMVIETTVTPDDSDDDMVMPAAFREPIAKPKSSGLMGMLMSFVDAVMAKLAGLPFIGRFFPTQK